MKLEFTKLITSNENIEIDFGDGRGFLPYPVNEAKAQGITIPNNIPDFNNIKIKGSTNVIPNLEVMKSIKIGKPSYEIHIKDYYPVITTYHSDGLLFENLLFTNEEARDTVQDKIRTGSIAHAILSAIYLQNKDNFLFENHNGNLAELLGLKYSYSSIFSINYKDTNNTLTLPISGYEYINGNGDINVPDFFYKSTDEIPDFTYDTYIVNGNSYNRKITPYDEYYNNLIEQLKDGVEIYYDCYPYDRVATGIKLFIDNTIDYSLRYDDNGNWYLLNKNTNIEYNISDENFHFGICDIVEC